MTIDTALTIPGWMSEVELKWLAEAARISDVIVEFGCYHGRSTRALADNTNGIVYAVDPWDGIYVMDNGSIADFSTAVFDKFEENLRDHISTGRVIPVKDFSWSFVPALKANLVFIDGDHRFELVLDDIKHAMKFLRTGGILAGHDYGRPDWPGVKKAVDLMFGPHEIETHDTIWSVRL